MVLQTSAAFTARRIARGARRRRRCLSGRADRAGRAAGGGRGAAAHARGRAGAAPAQREPGARVAERTRELAEANRRLEIESAERRKAEEALWHTQKLEAVGQLTGGIAHDFNNLLTVMLGNLEMIRAAFEAAASCRVRKIMRLLKAAETAADRGDQLTQQLLAFARRSTLRRDRRRSTR